MYIFWEKKEMFERNEYCRKVMFRIWENVTLEIGKKQQDLKQFKEK